MTRFAFMTNSGRRVARIAAMALGAASLSACAYGGGNYGGYGGVSVGVGSGGYAGGYDPYCDGYSAWDSFYGCDAGYGFGQIGFGGGYYDNFYYPGYGTWLFDRPGGRRFAMQDRHRQYWGQQRWQYQQQRRGNRQDFRQDRREDRRDIRQDRRDDRREDRRDWRQDQRTDTDQSRTGRGERERLGDLTPADRQQRLERRQQRQQGIVGQPGGQPDRQGEGRRNWQGDREGQGVNRQGVNRQGVNRQDGTQGRQRPGVRQSSPQTLSSPQTQAQPGTAPPRAERAARPQRQPRSERAPRAGPRSVPNRDGVRPQDVRPD